MIKPLIAALGLGLCLAGAAVHAEDAGKPMSAQQSRMADCNKQATGKKGAERKAFMKSCLSGKTADAAAAEPAKPATPQQRMKDCNKQAAGKKGEERKAFMKSCLKGS